ncbi:MAG: alpha/beta hydrolase fold domain-containing protein [Chthoniobacteraceae bacterium]
MKPSLLCGRWLLCGIFALASSLSAQDFSPEMLQRLLERHPDADTDKDGKLSTDELRALKQRLPKNSAKPSSAPKPAAANVKYGPHERNVLDFWKAESKQPAPVLVFIHGGGFVGGDKSQANAGDIDRCLAAGVSFASISYRYTTQAPYPAPMLDGARAIQFLRSKAAEWNIDPKRIGAYGGSAGAGISMWLGFHDDLAKPDSADAVERQSSRLVCVGSIGGQSSYDPLQIREWIGGRAWEHRAFIPFYAVSSSEEFPKPEVRKLAHDASVINHLTKDDAPVFMLYSEPDAPLPADAKPGQGIHHPKFGHILKEKMDALGIEAVYQHTVKRDRTDAKPAMIDWLIAKLGAPAK